MNEVAQGVSAVPRLPKIPAYRLSFRKIKDQLAKRIIALGGGCVILAIALIFCYLLYEVIPLFIPAKMTFSDSQAWTKGALPIGIERETPAHFGVLDELNEVLAFWGEQGITFVQRKEGRLIQQIRFRDLAAHANEATTLDHGSTDDAATTPHLVASSVSLDPRFALLTAGYLELFDLQFKVVYPKAGGRQVIPDIQSSEALPLALFENKTLENKVLDEQASEAQVSVGAIPNDPLASLGATTFRRTGDQVAWAGVFSEDRILVRLWRLEESLFGDGVQAELTKTLEIRLPEGHVQKMLFGPDYRWLYVLQKEGVVSIYDLGSDSVAQAPAFVFGLPNQREITSSAFLLGSVSLLLGDSGGRVTQLTPIRNDDNTFRFESLRHFDFSDVPITAIKPEQRRKGFLAMDAQGTVYLANTTSERVVLIHQMTPERRGLPVLSPRADVLAMVGTAGVNYFSVENHHPEISWHSLWQKVWYEGYQKPEYLWQSSAANNDFEPKMSLVPLSFGTLKAAFYAMVLAMPLAICGAIFTAYFMAPGLRKKVKPAIEMMEALPTVILGFLAGLWLAPFVEQNLIGIFALLFLTPVFFLVAALVIINLPGAIRRKIAPPGWEPLALIPVLLLSIAVSMQISDPIQSGFFGGDISIWLRDELGITYRQRNALVVGFAMGFAVIPTIFSIAEDAIFAVPKSLTQGSLALGASPWQTLARVVLPTASPGIFSAVMIGFGRAVGETMIVLMATGNTPIMDWNIFEGFRTLSANIAVELPEAEVHSTHFRILFLAALVLFMFTFVLNTTAEYVRQRLREKYGSL